MIGKPEWFTYRKFGWGVAPKTWQGWAYIGVFMAMIFSLVGLQIMLDIPQQTFSVMIGMIVALIIVDTMHIMFQLPRVHDERQNKHQLIIEKNSSLAAILAIVSLILYDTVHFALQLNEGYVPSGIEAVIPFDWKLGVVLAAMLGAKVISSLYLEKRM